MQTVRKKLEQCSRAGGGIHKDGKFIRNARTTTRVADETRVVEAARRKRWLIFEIIVRIKAHETDPRDIFLVKIFMSDRAELR